MELLTMTTVQQSQQQYCYDGYKIEPPFNYRLDEDDIGFPRSDQIKQEDLSGYSSVADESGHAAMRKLVNKLGGTYCSGKPLSLPTRQQIVAMAETGMKACDISRQLQISHGCVSKIIAKWRATGSFEPRRIGGSKPKKTLGDVVAAVRMYKRACPSIRSLEIRRRLLEDGICNDCNVPSLSSINRIIRMKLRDDLAEFEASAVRDLMAILATSVSPVVKSEGNNFYCAKKEPANKAAISKKISQISMSTQPKSQELQDQPVHESNNQHLLSQPFDCGSAYFEAKLNSLPSLQSYFSAGSTFALDETTSQMQSGSISKIRGHRNNSVASTTSTTSSCASSSFELPWQDELNPDSNEQRGSFSNFPNPLDVLNLNFEDNDLWSFLDELP